MNVIYPIGRWNNASRARARHIPNSDGRPLCWKPGKFGKVFSWQSEDGRPTCKTCMRLGAKAAVSQLIPHTDGPWHYEEGCIKEFHDWILGRVPYTLGGEQDLANGILFTAAPVMYLFVQNAALRGDDSAKGVLAAIKDAFDAAVVKAKGGAV